MDPMYMASAELLIVASQLGTAPATPPPDKLREELGKKLGGEVKIHSFLRYSLGEGIEKKQEDLAAEVAKTIGD